MSAAGALSFAVAGDAAWDASQRKLRAIAGEWWVVIHKETNRPSSRLCDSARTARWALAEFYDQKHHYEIVKVRKRHWWQFRKRGRRTPLFALLREADACRSPAGQY